MEKLRTWATRVVVAPTVRQGKKTQPYFLAIRHLTDVGISGALHTGISFFGLLMMSDARRLVHPEAVAQWKRCILRTHRPRPDLIPVGRFGKVEEVADVVVTLASNGYISGQTISINGVWYMT